MRVTRIERTGKAEPLKCQRIGDETGHGGVGIGSRLIAQQAGRVIVMIQLKPSSDEHFVVHPIHHFLGVVEFFVGITTLSEARRIAQCESIARIHNDLRQLAPEISIEQRLLECGRRIRARTQNRPPRRALGHGEQVRRQIRFPPRQQPLLASLARAKAVAAIIF